MALVSNLLNLLNVNPWANLMVTGLIIVIVVALNQWRGGDKKRAAIISTLPLFTAILVGALILYGVLK
jgi:ribose transport system permease protein